MGEYFVLVMKFLLSLLLHIVRVQSIAVKGNG